MDTNQGHRPALSLSSYLREGEEKRAASHNRTPPPSHQPTGRGDQRRLYQEPVSLPTLGIYKLGALKGS